MSGDDSPRPGEVAAAQLRAAMDSGEKARLTKEVESAVRAEFGPVLRRAKEEAAHKIRAVRRDHREGTHFRQRREILEEAISGLIDQRVEVENNSWGTVGRAAPLERWAEVQGDLKRIIDGCLEGHSRDLDHELRLLAAKRAPAASTGPVLREEGEQMRTRLKLQAEGIIQREKQREHLRAASPAKSVTTLPSYDDPLPVAEGKKWGRFFREHPGRATLWVLGLGLVSLASWFVYAVLDRAN